MNPDDLDNSTRRVRWLVLGMLARLAVDHPTFCGAVGQSYASDVGEEILGDESGEAGPLTRDEVEAITKVRQALLSAQASPEWAEEIARLRETDSGDEIAGLASRAFFKMMETGMPPYPP